MKDLLFIHVCLSLLGIFKITCREFRIAWMAPRREYHGLSAASSVGGIKLALISRDTHEGKVLDNHTIRLVYIQLSSAAVLNSLYSYPLCCYWKPCANHSDAVKCWSEHYK